MPFCEYCESDRVLITLTILLTQSIKINSYYCIACGKEYKRLVEV